MAVAIEIDDETKAWLKKLREEYGNEVYQQFKMETEMYNAMGFRANGEVPEQSAQDVPRIKYNGYLFIPNFYQVGDDVYEFIQGTIDRRGKVVQIKWHLRELFRKNYLLPSYKIAWNDGDVSWRSDAGLW